MPRSLLLIMEYPVASGFRFLKPFPPHHHGLYSEAVGQNRPFSFRLPLSGYFDHSKKKIKQGTCCPFALKISYSCL